RRETESSSAIRNFIPASPLRLRHRYPARLDQSRFEPVDRLIERDPRFLGSPPVLGPSDGLQALGGLEGLPGGEVAHRSLGAMARLLELRGIPAAQRLVDLPHPLGALPQE